MRLFEDTTPEAQRVYVGLLAQTSPEKKVQMVGQLYLLAFEAAFCGARARFPGATEEAIRTRVARLMLGDALAAGFLARRGGGTCAFSL